MTTALTPPENLAAEAAAVLKRRINFRRVEIQPQQFADVLRVEFRKLISTRANAWLAAFTLLVGLGTAAIATAFFDELFPVAGVPWLLVSLLIRMPVLLLFTPLIILLVTSEWGTRSVMTTFTLTPKREWVVLAKGIVTLVASLVVWLVVTGLAVATTHLGPRLHGMEPSDAWLGWGAVGKDLLGFLLVVTSAFAVALLVQNSAAAIAIVLAGPPAIQMLGEFGPAIKGAAGWVDLQGMIQQVLMAGDNTIVWKLIVAAAVWIVLPLALGMVRTLRREAA